MELFNVIIDWVNANPGKTIGVAGGVLLGILFFALGPLKTILIIVFVLAGYVIGKSRDDGTSVLEVLSRIFTRR